MKSPLLETDLNIGCIQAILTRGTFPVYESMNLNQVEYLCFGHFSMWGGQVAKYKVFVSYTVHSNWRESFREVIFKKCSL